MSRIARHITWRNLVLLILFALLLSFVAVHLYVRQHQATAAVRDLVRHRTLAPQQIQGWMTYEYLNVVFKLPPNYLRDTLSLNSPDYPSLTIKQSARESNADLATLVSRVQDAVRAYQP